MLDHGGWLLRHRYALLGTTVTLLVASQTRNQQWTKDIWLHAAVVGELARHPFSPGDPLIGGVGTPNEWLSPYGWAVGMVARRTGLAPLSVLGAMAVVNTVVLLVALWWFVVTFTRNRRAPFYVLLAVLVLWGPGAWRWSGFVHLDALGYVAAYPSTLSLALVLGILVAVAHLLEPSPAAGSRYGSWAGWAGVVAIGSWLVVLCHPPSAPVLAVGIAAVAVSRPHRPPTRALAVLAVALAVAAAAILAWPWFSVLHLDATGEIREPMAILYDHPLTRVAPALLGLPIVVLRSRAVPRDVLGLLLIGTTALYLVGGLSGHDEMGRTIAAAVLVLHVALGDGLGRLEARWSTSRSLPAAGWALVGASALAAVLGIAWLRAGALRMAPRQLWPASVAADARLDAPGDDLAAVRDLVPDGATVLAPIETSKYLPAFGAKVVASPLWAGGGVTDVQTRRTDVAAFFSPGTSAADRRAILDRYRPSYIVVDRDAVPAGLDQDLADLGLPEVGRRDRLIVRAVPDH